MKRRINRAAAAILVLLLAILALVTMTAVCHAETVKHVSSNAISYTEYDGNSFIEGRDGEKITGLVRYRGNIYYGHREGTPEHPVGSLARDCIKMIGRDWYYFGRDGKAQKHDSRYIDIRSRNRTVRYIYIPGTNRKQRYNTREERYQVKRHGRWTTVGMQVYPYGQMDWQR